MKNTPHCPFCCHIIPDVVFKQMKKEGIDVKADKSVKQAEDFREKRTEFSLMSRGIVSTVPGKAERYVFDSKNSNKMKLTLVRKENAATVAATVTDNDANWAYENGGIVRDYFKSQLGWDSIDGSGLDLIFNVHYLVRYNNAFWDGQMMTFGDGDGLNFTSFAQSLDVTGHELAHGVIQYTAGLVYKGQSGALNEHFADVFGIAVKQWHLKQTAQEADWLIGADCMGTKFKGKGIRSFKAPNDDKVVMMAQPDTMTTIYKGTSDNGGVHINSGIPNKVFYLVSLEIGTNVAAKWWFEALKILKPTAKFTDLYKALKITSKEMIPVDKLPANALDVLAKSFIKVGIIKKI
jgi:Zn-dependent metalloprotease